jgi:hypothetical protein
MKQWKNSIKNLMTWLKASLKLLSLLMHQYLIHYMEAFEGEIRYQLRDKDPTTLRDAQKYAIKNR